MFTVTENWYMPINIGLVVVFLLFILIGAKKGFLLMIVSMFGTIISLIGSWFFAGILADYIRLWPRKWAILQNTALAAASWQFMNHICWFLTLFLVLRLIFIFIEMICRGLQDVPFIKEISIALGGALGAAEAMLFVLVFSIALNSPFFNNGSAAVEKTMVGKINEVTGMVYEKLLEPLADADAFNQAYENASQMTNEQREKLREWLEKQGYKSDVEGYTVIEEEGQEGTTEGD
ncbi:MAG: CvpA family protein [Solobacterium sp.]|nr:CvpA family protein [Solobacterium sp.]MBQ9824706.1 CvpA family protein [Solobacterium sp.]